MASRREPSEHYARDKRDAGAASPAEGGEQDGFAGWAGRSRVLRAERSEVEDALPDVRDGLTRLERVILHELARAQRELESETGGGARRAPSTLLYGRVVEHLNVSPREFRRALTRLARRRAP